MVLLDDIHKHISANKSLNPNDSTSSTIKTPPFRRIDGESTNDDTDIEEGIVHGYAIQHAIPSGFVLPNNQANQYDLNFNKNDYHHQAVAGNKAG